MTKELYLNGFGVYPTVYQVVNGEIVEQEYSETFPSGTFFIAFDVATYDGNTVRKYFRMWNKLEHTTFWERYNSGFGNETYTNAGMQLVKPRHWLCKSISKLDNDADFVVIEGGINDYLMNAPLGEISEDMVSVLDITTTTGAIEYICRQLLEKYPTKKVAFCLTNKAKTYWRTLQTSSLSKYTFGEYHDRILEVLKKYSIPVIDLYNDSRFNTELTQYLQYTKNNDGVHPTEEGYNLFYVPNIVATLEAI